MENVKIGIFGGTFDPIHVGHLINAEWIRSALQLDKVILIPAKVPPHKKGKPITDAQHRFRMIELSVVDRPYFDVSSIEIDNEESVSYTWYTVERLQRQYPNSELYLLLGADTIYDLPNWRYIDKIQATCKLVGFNRAGERPFAEADFIKSKDHILFVDTPLIELSSSMIRKRISEGKTASYMVTDLVLQYIKENRLYGYMERMDGRG